MRTDLDIARAKRQLLAALELSDTTLKGAVGLIEKLLPGCVEPLTSRMLKELAVEGRVVASNTRPKRWRLAGVVT